MPKTTHEVVAQNWMELDRGAPRNDGFSLHLTMKDCERYRREYWKGMPKTAPVEYSLELGEPRTIRVDDAHHRKILDAMKTGRFGYRDFHGRIESIECQNSAEHPQKDRRRTPKKRYIAGGFTEFWGSPGILSKSHARS